MERERHEPTFGKPDLHDIHFRNDRSRPIRQSEPASPWIYIGVGAALLIAIAMGLIEWNARRQAAAMTREMMRPATPAEQAELNKQVAEWQRKFNEESADEDARLRRSIWANDAQVAPAPRPLNRDERCIDGRRFQRIDGGWRDRPNDPC